MDGEFSAFQPCAGFGPSAGNRRCFDAPVFGTVVNAFAECSLSIDLDFHNARHCVSGNRASAGIPASSFPGTISHAFDLVDRVSAEIADLVIFTVFFADRLEFDSMPPTRFGGGTYWLGA